MENASKALLIAGEILIGVLLLALMVYLFTSASALRASHSRNIDNTRMAEFNAKFTKYNITKEDYEQSATTKSLTYVTIHDIVLLAKYANEFNTGLERNSNDYIQIFFKTKVTSNRDITNDDTNESENKTNYSKLIEDNLINDEKATAKRFICTKVTYNETTGRIKSMSFDEVG